MPSFLKLIAELRKARLEGPKKPAKAPPPPMPTQVVVWLYGTPCNARDEAQAIELATLANRTLAMRAICAANGRRYSMEAEA